MNPQDHIDDMEEIRERVLAASLEAYYAESPRAQRRALKSTVARLIRKEARKKLRATKV